MPDRQYSRDASSTSADSRESVAARARRSSAGPHRPRNRPDWTSVLAESAMLRLEFEATAGLLLSEARTHVTAPGWS
ncbi:hypothetical protein ACFPRL_14445 [Pseudoclavibacter helvolus]